MVIGFTAAKSRSFQIARIIGRNDDGIRITWLVSAGEDRWPPETVGPRKLPERPLIANRDLVRIRLCYLCEGNRDRRKTDKARSANR